MLCGAGIYPFMRRYLVFLAAQTMPGNGCNPASWAKENLSLHHKRLAFSIMPPSLLAALRPVT
jgi:hypothetical protein